MAVYRPVCVLLLLCSLLPVVDSQGGDIMQRFFCLIVEITLVLLGCMGGSTDDILCRIIYNGVFLNICAS